MSERKNLRARIASAPQTPPSPARRRTWAVAALICAGIWVLGFTGAGRAGFEAGGQARNTLIRGGILIDGSGAPPIGPVDIHIRDNRIDRVVWRRFGAPDGGKPPPDTRVIDAANHYVLPGFVDLHGHLRTRVPADYIHMLWLAHGITSVRDPGCHRGIVFCVEQKDRSRKNAAPMPRFFPYVHTNLDLLGLAERPGYGWSKGHALTTAEMARAYVRYARSQGVDGFKTYGLPRPVFAALVDEAHKQKLGIATHLMQLWNGETNAVEAAELGVDSIEHWYGVPEALLSGSDLQPYTPDYNFFDEIARFSDWVGIWEKTVHPGSPKWEAVLASLLETNVTLNPTLAISESMRDTLRAANKPWFRHYAHPNVLKAFEPNPEKHGGFLDQWTSSHEAATYAAFHKWFTFLNAYKNLGGRVTLGTDAGVFFALYGFSYIREMELLQHAGFTPLEVIRAATWHGAQVIAGPTGKPAEFGLIREGYLADLLVIDGNPLENFKILGAMGVPASRSEDASPRQTTAIKYVVKDGHIYIPAELLKNVREMVAQAKQAEVSKTSGDSTN
ncbi:amidohydrolase family protein [Eilatimonas milleporae]|uniref:amidohydrolase family protein n=1 Tax=Eilatimonas milleporae TaxID=911205 RepID=UPI001473A122|nr:amidohydrolase family protein [Eilatimonas milleporae]